MKKNEFEQIIIELKEDIEGRPNKLVYMKYKNFLRKFGMSRRISKKLDIIGELLEKYEIKPYAKLDEGWYLTELNQEETITLRLKKYIEKSIQDKQIKYEYAGAVKTAQGENPIDLYFHQNEAISELNKKVIKQNKNGFAGLLVIPTGGGKTLTSVYWLLKNYIDKNKKVLWIAHRHELLEQALSTFKKQAYENLLKNRKTFNYRIISGIHDKPVNIKETDDVIVASKDSLNSGFNFLLSNWIENNSKEVILIIDEAHHSTAKTYRKLINNLKQNVENFKLIGLTATPTRTVEKEQGLLKKIFTDDIIYKIDLRTLINRGILSEPIFKELNTGFDMSSELTDKQLQNIRYYDIGSIGKETAKIIAENKIRNNRIVNHYIENKDIYTQTLLFALNVVNAFALKALFDDKNIKSEYVVSDVKDMNTGVTISSKENKEKIARFRKKEIQVLINVNILTEGVDVPNVQTVFLTRPTISPILMTQMIGRGLRGESSISTDADGNEIKGTKNTYIVSFIDNWKDKISWVNPEKLFINENADFDESNPDYKKQILRLIAISKIEEFAKLTDRTIDTSELETLDFIDRIPLGIYSFSFLKKDINERDQEKFCEVLVYDNIKQAYSDFVNDLDSFITINDNYVMTDNEISELAQKVEKEYFYGYEKQPGYRIEDIKDIIYYYDLKEIKPQFVEFKDRHKFSIDKLAKQIYEKKLFYDEMDTFLDNIWDKEKDIWQALFGYNNQKYFIDEIDREIRKIRRPDDYKKNSKIPTDIKELRVLTKLNMEELRIKAPEYWRKLRNEVYEKSKDSKDLYTCVKSGFKNKSKWFFQIDHIKPMSKGGLTVIENLQILKRIENYKKGNKE